MQIQTIIYIYKKNKTKQTNTAGVDLFLCSIFFILLSIDLMILSISSML